VVVVVLGALVSKLVARPGRVRPVVGLTVICSRFFDIKLLLLFVLLSLE
jgi:hypothetical protein